MNEKLELHAVVELFGHQKMAGKATEQSIGPTTFVRVDVPETKHQPAFTRLLNPSAIYAINPITEDLVVPMAERIQNAPIQQWDAKQMLEKVNQLALANSDSEDELPY